jgi:signal transduction histidine kinase
MARRIDGVIAFLTKSDSRRPPSAWALTFDSVIAVAATAYAIGEAFARKRGMAGLPRTTVFHPVIIEGLHMVLGYAAEANGRIYGIFAKLPQDIAPAPHPSPAVLAGITLTALPLAVRRKYPMITAAVILTSLLVIRSWIPPIVFWTAVFAAYSAIVYSRYRQLALGVVVAGTIAITATFPNTMPDVPERYTAIVTAFAVIAAGLIIREWRQRAGDSVTRLRRAQAEHEAATQRAVQEERARIAAELHDVLTHNVSVMLIQAGAARRVLTSKPQDAENALLAVERSGRTAMAELRQLLGLLCPPAEGGELRPQPGLGELGGLIARVSAAGLQVELRVSGTPRDLPPGLGLAAYRVVQEGLTNVIRHAGEAVTTVRLEWGHDLEITVSDDGSGTGSGPGSKHGLIGLRERLALYGGTLEAGPDAGSGWRLHATIPLPAPDGARHSARSADAVRVLAAQLAGGSAPATAMARPARASRTSSPGWYTLMNAGGTPVWAALPMIGRM